MKRSYLSPSFTALNLFFCLFIVWGQIFKPTIVQAQTPEKFLWPIFYGYKLCR